MLFLASIDRLSRDELLDLLAFAEGASFSVALREPVEARLVAAKAALAKAGHGTSRAINAASDKTSNGSGRLSTSTSKVLRAVAGANEGLVARFDAWAPNAATVVEAIARQRKELEPLETDELRKRLFQAVGELAAVSKKHRDDPKEVSRQALCEVAKQMKVETRLVAAEDVERIIFETHVEQMLKKIQTQLAGGGEAYEQELEKLLQDELCKLSRGDREAMKTAMGLDELTARSLISVFKSGGSTLATLVVANSFGFGAFLALTTMIKAVSLLLGITIGFGAYMAATSFLGFLLGPGLPVAVLAAGGAAGLWKKRDYRRTMLAAVVSAMHAKLALNSEG